MSACHTARIATVSFALTALIGFAEPAGAAITANALTNNAITANALTNNGLHVNGLEHQPPDPAIDQLDGGQKAGVNGMGRA